MNRAVIAIVKGGLGNQLFIYAAARALALRTGCQLYLDIKRGYTLDTYGRSYRLNRFPIRAEIMPEAWRVAPTLKHPRHKLIRAINKLLPRDRRDYFAERWTLPPSQLIDLRPERDRITLLGYWQDEAYFADCTDTIRAELAPSSPNDARNRLLGEELAGTESVFVHVRRVSYPAALPADYYRTALTEARRSLVRPRFVIFGDDLAWAKSELGLGASEATYVDHNATDELADLWLMTRCRHAITANSSFSWWGAWLGEPHAKRLVVVPKKCSRALSPAQGWQAVAVDG